MIQLEKHSRNTINYNIHQKLEAVHANLLKETVSE